ncbi:MAG: stage II sporulation protein D [Bacillota bacterium]
MGEEGTMGRLLLSLVAFLFGSVVLLPSAIVGLWAQTMAPVTDKGPAFPLGSPTVRLLVHSTGELAELPLEEYVCGVVAAEMPATFEPQALRAQAVIARTYVVKRMRVFGGKGCDEHPGADICDNPEHAQAWLSKDALRKVWGPLQFKALWDKVEQAVKATEGLVLTYQGKLIDPLYHSTCAGGTENPEEVWGTRYPYLKSVRCDFCASSPHYRPQKVSFKLAEFISRIGAPPSVAAAATGGRQLFTTISTSSGRVKEVVSGTFRIAGTEVRKLLGLKSTRFSLSVTGDQVSLEVRGNGHGVGLCQWGANGLALRGLSYPEIIAYYFDGVVITHMFHE